MGTTHTDVTNVNPFTFSTNSPAGTSAQVNAEIARLSDAGGGIVYLTSESLGGNTTIPLDGGLKGADNVTVYIDTGVTLQLTASVTNAYDVSYTSNAGLAGGGTFDVAGNAGFVVYGAGSKDTYVGGGRLPTDGGEPGEQLTIEGWKNGILIESTNTEAAVNPTFYDVVLQNPNDGGVNYPVRIGNISSQNGQFVDRVDIDGLTVDGGHLAYNEDGSPVLDENGVHVREGGAWSSDLDNNIYTADQITLQSVTGGTIKNTKSLNGGEVGITISRGSSDIVVSDTLVSGADGHGFNIGGGSYSIDINEISGIQSLMSEVEGENIKQIVDTKNKDNTDPIGLRSNVDFAIEGATSGATGVFKTLFWDESGADSGAGRIWINRAGGSRFQDNETITIKGYFINNEFGERVLIEFDNPVSTDITDVHLTENIRIEDSTSMDNKPEGTTSTPFADYYMQQAENIEIINSISKDSAYGLFVSTSSYKIDNVTFENIVKDITQVGDATRILEGTISGEQINGTGLADYIDGGDGNDILNGGNGNDILHGGNGDDTLRGQNGHDFIDGGAGVDTVFGANGNDFISGGAGADKLHGNAGQDIIEGGDGNDTVTGGSGDDIIFGQEGDDNLNGQSGNDVIAGGAGNDIINGGDGIDTVSYANASGGVTVNLEKNTGQNTFGDGDDKITNIENITGSDFADTLRGDADANVLTGNGGNDIIYGRNGNDTIDGGDGNDRLYGNEGNDTIDAGAGDDIVRAGYGDDAISGGDGADQLYGNSGHDTIDGGEGADVIYGGAGKDTISGGLGDDTIKGHSGNDIIYTGEGDDTVYGGSGADEFIFTTIGDGVSTIKDFSSAQGDIIDLSALLEGYDPLQDNINDFVFTAQVGGDTILRIDESGSGHINNATQVATLENVTDFDLATFVNLDGNA